MRINDKTLGSLDLTICIKRSAVDSFAEAGYSETFDRELTDIELDYIQDRYNAEIQEYALENGSRNHN